ncbi:TPA: hypothetical protein JAJ28_004417, partial [Aeromonas hydrophila]|nr:hypothetical protein [Aeromonas hydrophila]
MRIRFCGCLLLLSCLGTAQAELGKLEYLTEEYPPYNFTDQSGQPGGLAVELLQLIWQRTQTPAQPIRI